MGIALTIGGIAGILANAGRRTGRSPTRQARTHCRRLDIADAPRSIRDASRQVAVLQEPPGVFDPKRRSKYQIQNSLLFWPCKPRHLQRVLEWRNVAPPRIARREHSPLKPQGPPPTRLKAPPQAAQRRYGSRHRSAPPLGEASSVMVRGLFRPPHPTDPASAGCDSRGAAQLCNAHCLSDSDSTLPAPRACGDEAPCLQRKAPSISAECGRCLPIWPKRAIASDGVLP